MSRRPARGPRVVHVETVNRLSAGLVRIVFAGDDLEDFDAGVFTDRYVKIHFPPPGAQYGPPFDPAELRSSAPREQWPRTRTYTVRAWDPDTARLTIDFVVHGEEGVAGPWAAAAAPGDRLQLVGPGGAYAPAPDAEWHLLIGDESVLPAIAAAIERVPAGVPVHVLAQVPGPQHELDLGAGPEVNVHWLHGEEEEVMERALGALIFPPGRGQAFVHGEAAMVRAVRRHLLRERGLPVEWLSASGYWKRDRTEDGWREEKAEWNRLAEADLRA